LVAGECSEKGQEELGVPSSYFLGRCGHCREQGGELAALVLFRGDDGRGPHAAGASGRTDVKFPQEVVGLLTSCLGQSWSVSGHWGCWA